MILRNPRTDRISFPRPLPPRRVRLERWIRSVRRVGSVIGSDGLFSGTGSIRFCLPILGEGKVIVESSEVIEGDSA